MAEHFPLSAVVYARHMHALASFYEHALGLVRVEEGPTYVSLRTKAIDLAVVQIPPNVARTIHIQSPPLPREEVPIKLSFLVGNIESRRSLIAEHGGALKPAAAAWSWRGALHLDGTDPEGNVFQLRQSVG
jgi:hypothetical protein